ncbi:MAG: hypothetical protein ERJ67_05775, partial [Aphanocapsa feldmannii 277cV]
MTVTVGDPNDTATSADYDYMTNQETDDTDVRTTFDITIEADQPSGTAIFMLDPTHDTIDEGDSDETYETLTVSGVHGGSDVEPTSITIVDNDDPP